MDLDEVSTVKPEGSAPAVESISIIPNQDFEELDFSNQIAPDNDWESEHPIFMTKIPGELEDNSGLLALQDLKYGESTPEEVAEICKNKGNEFFAKGPQFYKLAIDWYTKALAEKINDPSKTSVFLSNRAAVNLELGNYAKTIQDCDLAIQNNHRNIKAYFRAAKAAAQLDKFEKALQYIEDALKLDPKNAGLLKEKTEIEQARARHQARIDASIARQKRQEAERAAVLASKKEWIQLLHDRNVAIGPYLFSTMENYLQGGVKPYLNSKMNERHWPVLFLYDEHRPLDFIQDFAENDTFGDHLKVMFPGDSFCDWDQDKKYVHSKLEVYFVVNQSPAFMKKNTKADVRPRKIKVNHNTPLRKVLEHPEYVIPGYPVFYVVVTGSKFKEEFVKRHIEYDE